MVWWDQLGCGQSEHPDDVGLWTMDRCVQEVEAVRQALDLGRVDLIGHSWGAMLAAEYATRHPQGLRSLVLLGGLPSAAAYNQEAARLREELPASVRAVLEQAEYGSLAYHTALASFYGSHYLWVPPALLALSRGAMGLFDWLQEKGSSLIPPELLERWIPGTVGRVAASQETMLRSRSYLPMWGPDPFRVTGNLRDWKPDLSRISCPALVLCGRHDVATPVLADLLREGIAGAQMHVFEHSAHFAMEEEPAEFRRVVEGFLAFV